MKKTLFEKIYEKYGIIIGKRLWCSQIEELQDAFDRVEKGENVDLPDPFVQIVFELIICDLKWQQRKAGEEDEKQSISNNAAASSRQRKCNKQ